ncbi:MAG: DUF748 domain-containing protein [Hyphomicrobiales bacterium]|nr:DUF748 domain-containing protein [Hyphomicrobiales bacterium]
MRYIAITLAVILSVAFGALLIAPGPVVGFVAGRVAAWSHIETQGLDSLDIDLFKGTISAGPLSFSSASAAPGKIGRFHADIDVSRLFTGRIALEDVHLADVDLALAVEPDGSYTLNGIHMGPSGGEHEEDDEEGQDKKTGVLLPPFSVQEANIESLHVMVTQAPDLVLPLDVDHLQLKNLSAETPDQPATFAIAGEAREIRFDYTGTALAFRDPIEITLDGQFGGLTMQGIEMFAGSLGLARRSGVFGAKARHEIALTREGAATITSVGSMTTDSVDLAWPDSLAVRLDHGVVNLDMKATVTPDGRRELSNRGPINATGLSIAWSETGSVKVETATVNVVANARIAPDQQTQATLSGSVPLKGLIVAWSEKGAVRLDDGTADLELAIDLAPDGKMTIAGPMAVKGGDGGIHSGGSFKLSYQGIDAEYPDASIELEPDGTAIIAGTPLATLTGFALDAPVTIRAATAVVKSGSVHVIAPMEGVLVEYDGTLDLTDAQTPIGEDSRLRMGKANFILSKFRYDEDPTLAADLHSDIMARMLDISKDPQTSVKLPVSDAEVDLAGLDLKLTPEGGIRRFAVDSATHVTLEGTARGHPHRATVRLERFEVTDLDPAAPDQLTRVDLLAVINESGRIELTEEVKPFAQPPEFVFAGSVKDLELPQLSPYFAAAVGLDVNSGRFDAKGHAVATDGKLDGVLDVDIQTLELETASKDGGDPAADLTGVPVTLAVAVLEDSDQRINVSLPFSGDLSSPEVGYCDVIRTALLGAVRVVVTAPFKGVASAASGSGLALEPVPFEAGSASVSTMATRQLDHVASLLAEKPSLRFKVCGQATRADAAALGATKPQDRLPGGSSGASQPGGPQTVGDQLSSKMVALAQERTRAAKEYLQNKANVRENQVQECRPGADANDPGPPRVETRF